MKLCLEETLNFLLQISFRKETRVMFKKEKELQEQIPRRFYICAVRFCLFCMHAHKKFHLFLGIKVAFSPQSKEAWAGKSNSSHFWPSCGQLPLSRYTTYNESQLSAESFRGLLMSSGVIYCLLLGKPSPSESSNLRVSSFVSPPFPVYSVVNPGAFTAPITWALTG